MRADNQIGAAAAASLAPSLGRMAQLTSLNLESTLRGIGWVCAVSGCLRTPDVHGWCVLRAETVGLGAVGVVVLERGHLRGGCACRQWLWR